MVVCILLAPLGLCLAGPIGIHLNYIVAFLEYFGYGLDELIIHHQIKSPVNNFAIFVDHRGFLTPARAACFLSPTLRADKLVQSAYAYPACPRGPRLGRLRAGRATRAAADVQGDRIS